MTTSAETMPAAPADPNAMDLEAVQAELAGYQPATSSAVVGLEAYMARRVRLWARLDELSGIRKPAAAATGVQQGAQQA